MALEASIRIIYDRRKKASATVKGGVEIEVYYNRQRIRFATGVNVLKQQWKGGMVANHPDAHKLNEQIINLYETIDQRMATMRRRGVIDLDLLKEAKVEEENNSSNFLDWLEERIYKRDVKESTRRQHFVMLGELRKFGKIVNFRDLTTRNIKLWDDELRQRLSTQSTVHGYHKRLKPYILEAIQLELIKDNPYNGMKIPRGKSEGIKYLAEEEYLDFGEPETFDTEAEALAFCAGIGHGCDERATPTRFPLRSNVDIDLPFINAIKEY